ncbi:hypothetical protein P9112_000934 [Eukaryota sp. TZLM1-RC]
MSNSLSYTLKNVFNLDSFRPGQEDAIRSILQGQDVFVNAPTGFGKSLTYLLPSLLKPGLCFCVFPLVSLLNDQRSKLKTLQIPYGILAPSLDPEQSSLTSQLLNNMEHVNLKVVLTTPESITLKKNLSLLESLYSRNLVSFFTIDECHLVCEWNSFRSAFNKLNILRSKFPSTPLLALTATASKEVKKHVFSKLKLKSSTVTVTVAPDRPNIKYSVLFKELQSNPLFALQNLVKSFFDQYKHKRGIVFVHKRSTCEELSQQLKTNEINTFVYHAGLEMLERNKIQTEFGQTINSVICCTISFGLGVDVNADFVIHYQPPHNINQFYQESGRCGRDGSQSESVVFYDREDLTRYKNIFALEGRQKHQSNAKSVLSSSQSTFQEDYEEKMTGLEDIMLYCEARRCKRAVLLKHFAATVNPERDRTRCCDYCENPKKINIQLSNLEMRQVNSSGLHTSEVKRPQKSNQSKTQLPSLMSASQFKQTQSLKRKSSGFKLLKNPRS